MELKKAQCRMQWRNFVLAMLSLRVVMLESYLSINEVTYASLRREDDQGEVVVEYLRFEFLIALKIHFVVLRVTTRGILIGEFQRFGGIYSFRLQEEDISHKLIVQF
jgi:hypothetical protein